ncbi:histidine kinase [Puia sp. P3]|uniref:histidine kinase n=1 Tax=Puia sp. P3 TaxID=3423952 RepID=UPI003D66F538
MLVASLWVFFNYSAFSFGYYFAFQSIRRQKELRIAEKKSMQAQQETLMAEYSFLRSQINPHFLHNTLNFFYAKSLRVLARTCPTLSSRFPRSCAIHWSRKTTTTDASC